MGLILRDVELEGGRTDVRTADGRVVAVGPRLDREGGDDELDGLGGALLPGLHDHHLHLLAAAADRISVRCGPPAVTTAAQLQQALATGAARTEAGRWLRGTGYHESVAGDLDRHALDALIPDRPARIQHRSGALWMLNSPALHLLGADPDDDGRWFRRDHDLRHRTGTDPGLAAETARLVGELRATGLTGGTDATPDLDVAVLADAAAHLPFRLHLLGAPTGARLPQRWTTGPWKLLLHDHDLPDFDALSGRIAAVHAQGRAVAVHCVTRTSLLLTLAALEHTGAVPGDRIEHAAVVPPEARDSMRRLGVRVVTQPGFLRLRGDDYARDADPDDVPLLYPWASLAAAGVPVAPSSDAPYGEHDPWRVMADAAARTTATGRVLGPGERVPAATVLDGYLSDPATPGGPPRRVRPGAPADLVLLHVPLAEALAAPHRTVVRVSLSG